MALEKAKEYARSNIKDLASEIKDWKSSSILQDGKLRVLAKILEKEHEISSHYSLTIAESICNDAFAEFVISNKN